MNMKKERIKKVKKERKRQQTSKQNSCLNSFEPLYVWNNSYETKGKQVRASLRNLMILLLNAVPKIFMNLSKGKQPQKKQKRCKGLMIWTDQ